MATKFFVDLNNQTDQTWTLAVYQVLPDSIGLDSVAWKQTTVPQSGTSGVDWTVNFNVALANFKQDEGIGVYQSSQLLSADLGTQWQIIFKDHVQQLIPDGDAPREDQIIIANSSGDLANPGIGMDGSGSVYKHDVLSGAGAQFTVTPTYFAGLFNDVELGEVISSDVTVGPLELKFDGHNKATITATSDGKSIILTVDYSTVHTLSLDVVQQRIQFRNSRRKALKAA
jgi:hypothetical protein